MIWGTKGPSIEAKVHRDLKVSKPIVNQSINRVRSGDDRVNGALYQSSAPHGYNGEESMLSISAADIESQNNTLCGLWNDRDRHRQYSGIATAAGVEPNTC